MQIKITMTFYLTHTVKAAQFSQSVQWLSRILLFATPWTIVRQASLSITNYQSLPKLMSTESVIPSNHLILCHPLLLLPSIFSSIRVFSSESALHIRWPKYFKKLSFSFSISPSNEYWGLISFRMDWLDLLAVQGTLKSLLQHHSSKASILQHSAFFIGQLSHPYMTAGICILQLTKNGISQISSQLNLVSIVWYNRVTTSLANELMSQPPSHFNRDFLEMEFLYFYCVWLIFFILYWRTASEQCCYSLRWTARVSVIHTHAPILAQTPLPSRLPHNMEQSSLCYAVGHFRLSTLNITLCTWTPQTP